MNSTQCNYFWKYIYHVDQNRVNVTHLNFFNIKCKNKIKNWNCDWAIYVSVSGPDFDANSYYMSGHTDTQKRDTMSHNAFSPGWENNSLSMNVYSSLPGCG